MVELHPSEPRQIAADVPVPECLARDAAVCEIVENRLSGIEHRRIERIQSGEILLDLKPESQDEARRPGPSGHSPAPARPESVEDPVELLMGESLPVVTNRALGRGLSR